jgi:RecJ-like exonuclease
MRLDVPCKGCGAIEVLKDRIEVEGMFKVLDRRGWKMLFVGSGMQWFCPACARERKLDHLKVNGESVEQAMERG